MRVGYVQFIRRYTSIQQILHLLITYFVDRFAGKKISSHVYSAVST